MVPKVLETAPGEWLGVLPASRVYLDTVPGAQLGLPGAEARLPRVGMLCLLASDLPVASGFSGLIDWRLDGQLSAAVRAGVFVPQRDAWMDLGECSTLSNARLILLGIGAAAQSFDLVQWQGMGRTVAHAVESVPEVDTWLIALPAPEHSANDVATFVRGLVAGRQSGKIAAWDARGGERPSALVAESQPSSDLPDVSLEQAAQVSQHMLRGLELIGSTVHELELEVVDGDEDASDPEVTEFTSDDLEVTTSSPPPPPPLSRTKGADDANASVENPEVPKQATNLAESTTMAVSMPSLAFANIEPVAASHGVASGPSMHESGAMRNLTWWIVTTQSDLASIQSRIGAALGQLPLGS